jgi:uncharacterized protein
MPGSIEIPGCRLKVNGSAMKDNITWQITRITVDDQVELPSMFTLELAATDETGAEPDWLNKDTVFAIGDQVDIGLGWGDSMPTVMIGEITSVEIEYLAANLPRFIVRGYDRRHRLLRGTKTRTFVKKTDSDIAKQIAREAGLKVGPVTETKIKHEFLAQANQTDFAFLQARARQLHYALLMRNGALYYQPVGYKNSATLTLSMDEGLSEFRAQLSTAGQVSQAKAQGWDIKKKEVISTSAAKPAPMGSKSGPDLANKAFGQASTIITNIPTSVQAYAQQVADASLAASALGLVRGEGQCEGNPKINAGEVIEIKGVGNRFSGKYYMTTVTHSLGPDGYVTQFTGWRNAT